jgi:hypothetical protein
MNLDDELKRLFVDERLEVPARPGAEDVIVAGAQRVRRRRIATVTASGALAVAAVVAASVLLTGGHQDAMPPANHYKNTPTSTTSTTTTTGSTTQSSTTQNLPTGTVGGDVEAPPTNEEENTEPSSPTSAPPPALDYPVLGPTGFQSLWLGQTQQEAEGTGMVGVSTGQYGDNCSEYQLLVDGADVGLVYFRDGGLVALMPFTSQTPEGVGPGWTVEQAAAAYPDLDVEFALANRYAIVSVPGNPDATFRLLIDGGLDEIVRITMQTAAQPCFP